MKTNSERRSQEDKRHQAPFSSILMQADSAREDCSFAFKRLREQRITKLVDIYSGEENAMRSHFIQIM